MTKQLVYLAAPYSHPDAKTRHWRFHQINKAAAHLIQSGEMVFSPISHSHPIAEVGNLPTGFDYYEDFDTAILSICRKIIVLMLPGWQESIGVAAELKIAEKLGIEIEYQIICE